MCLPHPLAVDRALFIFFRAGLMLTGAGVADEINNHLGNPHANRPCRPTWLLVLSNFRRGSEAFRKIDKKLLCRESGSGAGAAGTYVGSIRLQQARLAGIGKIRVQNFVANAVAQLRIVHRKYNFDTLVEIAWHQVGAAEVNLRISAVFEAEDAAMLQEAADDGPHADATADIAQARPQCAHTADDQIDRNTGVRGRIKLLDDLGIKQRVHLHHDARRLSASRVLRLTRDKLLDALPQIYRCDQ